jgi:hypothetical protein
LFAVGLDGVGQPDHQIIAAVLGQGEQRWGVPTSRSIFRNLLFSIADNSTLSIRHRVQSDSSGHLQRLGRDIKHGEEQQTEGELYREVEKNEEQGRTWDMESENFPVPEESRHEVEEMGVNKPNSFVELNEPFEFMEEKVDLPTEPAPRYGHAACM